MSVTDIGEARRRREEAKRHRGEHRAMIATVADWIVCHHPFLVPWHDDKKFCASWPGLVRAELDEIAAEIDRRLAGFLGSLGERSDLDAAAQGLTGRYDLWTRAANWLLRHPDRGLDDPDFVRFFGDITGAEFMLAMIERQRRLVASAASERGGQ